MVNEQNIFIEKMKVINDTHVKLRGIKQKAFIKIFGCQMNVADGEKIQWLLKAMGYEKADNEKFADLIIYVTCCVRENAENKILGNLGYLKRIKEERPELKIVLCGCMVQQGIVVEKIKKAYGFVDIIFGTFNLHRFPRLLYESMESGGQLIDIWKEHGEVLFDGQDLKQDRSTRFKASVNIMYGCDNYCTYCVVPYVRGRERSREAKDILTEIKALVQDGVKEILLLGQNVNSYGTGLHGETGFPALLRSVNEIEGIERIRFMTSHPKDLSDMLIGAISDCEKVCHHIHLPFQSGSTDILRKMNRKYTKQDYLQLIEKLRTTIPDIAITTDIIVGFPQETEEDFLQTIEVVEKARFSGAFTFLYSKRAGTPAAEMDDQVPEETAKRRFQTLVAKANDFLLAENQKLIGSIQKVLVEESAGDGGSTLTGRADNNSIVHFNGDPTCIGQIVPVKIIGCKTFYLKGELI